MKYKLSNLWLIMSSTRRKYNYLKLITSLSFLIGVCFFAIISGCTVSKKTIYFNDLASDSLIVKRVAAKFDQPRIQIDDILNIQVTTIDPASTQAVNQTMSNMAIYGAQQNTIEGFVVDKTGSVQLNILGKVRVVGSTTFEARNIIEEVAKKYYLDPSVQVRFANYKITVLGEVVRPATYTVPNEKVSILDAIGLAGDITIHGRRDNILLVRELDGVNQFVRLNLNDSKLLSSPFFHLKQGDVLYVEPAKSRIAQTNTARMQTISLITSAVSIVTLIVARIL